CRPVPSDRQRLQSQGRPAVRRPPPRRVRDVSLARLGVQRHHGQGPGGVRRGAGSVFAVEEREDGVYVQTPPVMPRKLVKHKPAHLLEVHPRPPAAPPRVLVISTTAMDDVNPRFSTSDALLDHALDEAKRRGADTQYIKLRDLKFRHCEGNYSKAARACTWPCAITERDPDDQ